MTVAELVNTLSFHPGFEITFSNAKIEGLEQRNYFKLTVRKHVNGMLVSSNKVVDLDDVVFVDSTIQMLIDEVEKMTAKNS